MNEPKTPTQLRKEWNLKKLEDGTLRLNSYKGFDTEIEVPAAIGKDAVTALGPECMAGYTLYSRASSEQVAHRQTITSVVIPEGVTTIGDHAFFRCERLETVKLPSTLKFIDERAFCGCFRLRNIQLPDGVQLAEGVFNGCTGLEDDQGVILRNGVLFSAGRAEKLVLPAGVTAIDPLAFQDALALREVTFPEGLQKLPEGLLRTCKALQTVTIPPSVTDIGIGLLPYHGVTVYGYRGSAAERLQMSYCCKKFVSLGVIVKEKTDFVIENGVLTRYTGKEKTVIVPDGVRAITSYGANSWNSIGAFAHNKVIEQVILPDSVEVITGRAFAQCEHLQDIRIPDSLVSTEVSTFDGTPWLASQPQGALYAGKVLLRYDGTDPELIVRTGTIAIGDAACTDLHTLTRVVLPEGLVRIGEDAFCGCTALEEIVVPASVTEIADGAFSGVTLKRCGGTGLHRKDRLSARFKIFYNGNPTDTAWLALYQPDATWRKAVRDAINAHPEMLSDVIRTMADLMEGMTEPDKTACTRAGAFALEMCKGVEPEALQALYRALQAKKQSIVQKLAADEVFQQQMAGGVQEDLSALHPVEARLVQELKYTPAFEKVLGNVPAGVHYAHDTELCARRVIACIVYAYVRQYDPDHVRFVSSYKTQCTTYTRVPQADEAAAALEPLELQKVLLKMAEQQQGEYWLPYARYADDKHVVSLLSQMRTWDNWTKYGATGRKCMMTARSGLLLNDTKAAMIHMDQTGNLELYASLRGTDAETLRDTVLADFGFDADRTLRYDLGGNTVEVQIDRELNLTLFDTNAGKFVKSIPKKGADPDLHAKAKSALSDLCKNIKKVVTNRKHLLFADFLSGKARAAEAWQSAYVNNPVLYAVARLLVWAQGNATFVLTDAGAVDCTGALYTITDAPVRVAHPLEMSPEECAAWQQYFQKNGLRQPFEQVWEPVYDPAHIRPDRYEGITMKVYQLTNREAHGIRVWGLGSYSNEYGFTLTDCEIGQKPTEWTFVRGITDKEAGFELGKFHFTQFTRAVNHIVYLFDKWTVTERVLKDDVSVRDMLEGFTQAQIMEFIRLATEHGSVNCAAMLLSYQNAHFEAFDPMAEFTLDL